MDFISKIVWLLFYSEEHGAVDVAIEARHGWW